MIIVQVGISIELLTAYEDPPSLSICLQCYLCRHALFHGHGDLLLCEILRMWSIHLDLKFDRILRGNFIFAICLNVDHTNLDTGDSLGTAICLLHDIIEPGEGFLIGGTGGSNFEHCHTFYDRFVQTVRAGGTSNSKCCLEKKSGALSVFHGSSKVCRINQLGFSSSDQFIMRIQNPRIQSSQSHTQIPLNRLMLTCSNSIFAPLFCKCHILQSCRTAFLKRGWPLSQFLQSPFHPCLSQNTVVDTFNLNIFRELIFPRCGCNLFGEFFLFFLVGSCCLGCFILIFILGPSTDVHFEIIILLLDLFLLIGI
mmetsp:Transcript_18077/g.26550  ORF Transcript_18077/g.26550 Transcript_18077/m.26550 type:complete len:311 (-) Transcript_18077:100-1032(-)